MEFAPDKSVVRESGCRNGRARLLSFVRRGFGRLGVKTVPAEEHRIYSYDSLAAGMVAKPDVSYPRFRCITPGWDNSARRQRGATIFVNSSPKVYEAWLRKLVQKTEGSHAGEERIVFINAWNEWAEGNHLEPDQRWGHGFLESTLRGSLASTERNVDAST